MSRARAATPAGRGRGRGKNKQTAGTAIATSDDADDDRPQQTADAAAAPASARSSSSRPRRSAAAHAQLKLLQQAFESERPPVSSQTAPTNGQQTGAEAAALAAPTAAPAAAADAAAAATAAAAPEAPRRRGRPPKQNGAHIAAAAAPTTKRAVTGKRGRPARSPPSGSESDEESDEAEAAAVAAAELRSMKARGGSRGGRGRGSAAKPPPRKKVRGGRQTEGQRGKEEEEQEKEEDEEDRDAARSARRPGGRRGRAAAGMRSDEETDSGSDSSDGEDDQSDAPDSSDAEEEEEERSGEEEKKEPPSHAEVDPPLEERSAGAADQSQPPSSGAVEIPSAATAAASAAASGAVAAMSVMDLLGHSDYQSEIGLMRLATQVDDDSLAALLMSRSTKDGSTFLQRFYRIYCTIHTKGFGNQRLRLQRLIKTQAAFHASTRNHAGQTLLHTLCSIDTYRVHHRSKNRRHWMYPDQPEYSEWTSTSSRMHRFCDQLCELLQRAGADFMQPDGNGLIPLLGLVELLKERLIDPSTLVEVIFRQEEMEKKIRGRRADRTLPIDLSIADLSGTPLLARLFEKPKHGYYEKESGKEDASWLSIGKMLCDHSHQLSQVDLFAVDSSGQSVIGLLADTCRSAQPRYRWTSLGRTEIPVKDSTSQLPQRLLKAWQGARKPLLRAPLEAWLIPDLADICCEYLLGSTQKNDVAMSPDEQERVFGVRPLEIKKEGEESASATDDTAMGAAAAAGTQEE